MTDFIIPHIFNNTEITQRSTDGYIDATAMCKANGKKSHDYFRLKTTQAFLEALSKTLGIPLSELVIAKEGGNQGGTFIHPQLITHLTHWLNCSRSERVEDQVQLLLWTKVGGKREVKTLAGTIDILTSTELIEVKQVNSWINGVGQLLIYGSYYPSHQKRLHLFGETQVSMLEFIQSHCDKLNIFVTWS